METKQPSEQQGVSLDAHTVMDRACLAHHYLLDTLGEGWPQIHAVVKANQELHDAYLAACEATFNLYQRAADVAFTETTGNPSAT